MLRNKSEKNLDSAWNKLKNSNDLNAALIGVTEKNKAEFSAMLSLMKEMQELPKKTAPAPLRRRLFAEHIKENITVKISRFSYFVQNMRTSSAVVVAVAILAITGTAYAASNSLPGSPLFTLRKDFDNAQISWKSNSPESRAQLELSLANQRLNQAQQVFSDQTSNNQDKEQAVQELNSQTQVAINQIQQVASSSSVSKNPGIIQNLENLTSKQASLQAQVNPQAAQNTAQQNQQAITQIKNLVAVANDKSSASVQAPTNVHSNGTVVAIAADSITVDKNVFQINSSTQFMTYNGSPLSATGISIGDTVSISGTASGDLNIAQSIILLETAPAQSPTSTNTSASTGTSSSANTSANTSTDTSSASQDNSTGNVDNTASSIPENVNSQPENNLSGGFILESPQ